MLVRWMGGETTMTRSAINGGWHPTPETRDRLDRRDTRIRELYALGHTRQELAERFDLSIPRIMQIVSKP